MKMTSEHSKKILSHKSGPSNKQSINQSITTWAGHIVRREEGRSALKVFLNHPVCICFDGVVIAGQCTATFSKIYCVPPNLGIRK